MRMAHNDAQPVWNKCNSTQHTLHTQSGTSTNTYMNSLCETNIRNMLLRTCGWILDLHSHSKCRYQSAEASNQRRDQERIMYPSKERSATVGFAFVLSSTLLNCMALYPSLSLYFTLSRARSFILRRLPNSSPFIAVACRLCRGAITLCAHRNEYTFELNRCDVDARGLVVERASHNHSEIALHSFMLRAICMCMDCLPQQRAVMARETKTLRRGRG